MNSKLGKVLYFSYFFPPTGGISCQRTIRFVKYLKKYGWDITVVASGDFKSWRVIDNSLLEKVKDVKKVTYSLRRIASFYNGEKNLANLNLAIRSLHGLDPMHIWTREVKVDMDRLIKKHKPDIAIITIPPFSTAELAESIKKIDEKIKVILDIRDLFWVFKPYGSFMRRVANIAQNYFAQKKFRIWMKYFEGFIVPDESFTDTIENYSDSPVETIPTPFDPDDFNNLKPYSKNEKFTILHSGSFNRYNSPNLLKIIFHTLPDEVLSKTELILQGNMSKKAEKIFNEISFIRVEKQVPFKYALQEQCKSELNLVFVSVPNGKGGEQIVPGKVFDYIGAGRPILAIGPKNCALLKLIKSNQLGFWASIKEPEIASGMITKAFRQWQNDKLMPIGKQRETFEAMIIVKRLSNFLSRLI